MVSRVICSTREAVTLFIPLHSAERLQAQERPSCPKPIKQTPPSFPFFSSSLHFTPLPASPFLFLPFHSLNPASCLGSAVSSLSGAWGGKPESNLVHFSLEMSHLVAIILLIFRYNQLTKFGVV